MNRLIYRKIINTHLRHKGQFPFSTNPYYILGIEQNSSFTEIKKAYYTLAAQYHPDINKSPTAPKQFISIKEAYEKIKLTRGEGVAQTLQGDNQTNRTNFHSVRKDSNDYEETWNKEQQDKSSEQADYKEFIHKADGQGTPEDRERFGRSFDAMNELKEGTFRPIDLEMPDASKRFHLDRVMKLKVFSDGSTFYIAILFILGCGFFFLLNISVKNIGQRQSENYIYTLLNYQRIKEDLDEEDFIERINYDLKKSIEYKEFVKTQESSGVASNELRRRNIPVIQEFISTNSIKTQAQVPL